MLPGVDGDVFHALFRTCLAEQRDPTDPELNIVARKIWQDAFAMSTGQQWQDLSPSSDSFRMIRDAARMALGGKTPRQFAH